MDNDTEEETPESPAPSGSHQASPTLTMLPGIKPPGKLDLRTNIVDNWKTYKQTWQNYAIITNLNAQPEEYQVALFLHCIGSDALRIYNGFDFANEGDKKSISKTFELFDNYAMGEVNETYERYVFNSRNQHADESIDAYITVLRNLAKTCNFCDCLNDTLLRDRIVLGIQNQAIRKRLLQDRKLTLKKCIDLCRSMETASSHLKNIKQEQPPTDTVRSVHQPLPRTTARNRTMNSRRSPHSNTPQAACHYCGTEHPMQKEKCPAWGKSCSSCGGRNHFARVCRKTMKAAVHAVQEEKPDDDNYGTSDDDDAEYVTSVSLYPEKIHSVNAIDDSYANEIYAEFMIKNQRIKFQIDSGATINILPEKYVKGADLKPTTKRLRMWNNSEVSPLGTTRIVLKNPENHRKYSIEFVVVHGNLLPIIGARAAQQMKIITVHTGNFTPAPPGRTCNKPAPLINALCTTQQVISQYPDIFQRELGILPGEVHLEVNTAVPPVITPARRIPAALRPQFRNELDRLQKLGVIEPVNEPTPWVNSVAIATRKSGSMRICIDPRPLNTALQRERHQMVILDEILPELSKAKVFSTVDLRAGYWHCPLDEASSMLTTFATPYGRYRWLRLPFGLSVSAEIFQKRVNQALDGLDGTLNISDDILLYGVGDTKEEAVKDHDAKLVRLLERCRKTGIALNPEKLKLRMDEVVFMGHVLTSSRIKIDPEKVKAVTEMQPQQSKKCNG